MRQQFNPIYRYVYFFNKDNPKGGVTIGFVPVLRDSKGYPQGIFALVAVAYCNPNDQFSRPKGREMVSSMLNAGEAILLPIYTDKAPVRFLANMFDDYVEKF